MSNQSKLNKLSPGARDAALGDCINDLITNYNALAASYAQMQTQYTALLAHIDSANVTGIGNANHTNYAVAAPTNAQIVTLAKRAPSKPA